MKTANWIAFGFVAASLALGGCGKGKDPKEIEKVGAHKDHAEKHHEVKGKVTAVNPDKPGVKLDHEEIAGLMKAMEMEFWVEDPKLLEGIEAGDRVQGQLKVDSGKYILIRLEKEGKE